MAVGVAMNERAVDLIVDGVAEGIVGEEMSDVRCQIRIDWLNPHRGIVDLKTGEDLRSWAGSAGWHLKIVEMPADEKMFPRVQRINDVILSCLYGLPVATTYGGQPAVIVDYDHLSNERLRVRLPGQPSDQQAAGIRICDEGWGPTWVFLAGRTAQAVDQAP